MLCTMLRKARVLLSVEGLCYTSEQAGLLSRRSIGGWFPETILTLQKRKAFI